MAETTGKTGAAGEAGAAGTTGAAGAPAPRIRMQILYRDEGLIAVDKPVGLIVHGDGTGKRTLADELRDLLRAEGAEREAAELQPLQRLDRETSGIVLFSTCKQTQPAFDRLIAERGLEKRYLAIVRGRFPAGIQTYDAPLGRDRHDARRMRVSRSGKSALTKARRLDFAPADDRGPARSLVEVGILTGRKHQIRVHLSNAGYPVMGDELYGHPSPRERDLGLMLHASEEAFEHPVTGERVHIESPAPARFKGLFPEIGR